jgi:hypothetical protein
MTWKASQYNPLSLELTELALDIFQAKGREIELTTDTGWFDHAELIVYWHAGRFEASLTIYADGHTCPGTLYEPPETVYNETTESESFIKIRKLNEWAKSHGFEIEIAQRRY